MEIFERVAGVSLVMRASSVATLVLTTILAPLLAGISVRAVVHANADRIARPVSILASVLLIVSALPILIGLAGMVVSVITEGTVGP